MYVCVRVCVCVYICIYYIIHRARAPTPYCIWCRNERSKLGMTMVIVSFSQNSSRIIKMERYLDCCEHLISSFCKKLEQACIIIAAKATSIYESIRSFLSPAFHFLVFDVHPFWLNLCYLLLSSVFGFFALKATSTPPPTSPTSPSSGRSGVGDLDLFFTSVSAITTSSMSTVEMEAFSNAQLVILTVLMLLGGQVFISMLALRLKTAQFLRLEVENNRRSEGLELPGVAAGHEATDVVVFPPQATEAGVEDKPSSDVLDGDLENQAHKLRHLPSSSPPPSSHANSASDAIIRYKAIQSLSLVVFGYLFITHIIGTGLVSIYVTLVSSAHNVLKSKSLQTQTFSVFLTVSSISNCGFVPTNENLMRFKENSGLLLILIPQILLGNALYAPCLRLVIWAVWKLRKPSGRGEEYGYLLKVDGRSELGFEHLMPRLESWLLVITGFGFVLVQFVGFLVAEWGGSRDRDGGGGGVLGDGLNGFQKLVGFMFQAINTRHSGESVVDLSLLSPAILLLLVVMMYLPPYTSFVPIGKREEARTCKKKTKGRTARRKRNWTENVLFSQLTYVAIFVILICITERDDLREDPLNFSVFNIVIEVISAYGNVGYSTGYSCSRRFNQKEACEDKWYGFAGHWSAAGKVVLILVMIFGRLKKFNRHGGRAWKVS